MARVLPPRSYEVRATIYTDFAEYDLHQAIVEVLNDRDCNVRHAEVVKKNRIRFEMGENEDTGAPPTRMEAKKLLRWTTDEDFTIYSLTISADPVPYDEDEQEDIAKLQAGWARVDALWPTLRPNERVNGAVVVRVDGDFLTMSEFADTRTSPTVYFGKQFTVERLDLRDLVRSDMICHHGRQDLRLPRHASPCADCDREDEERRFSLRCMLDGMIARVVL
jgi:hypothetical protein